MEQITVKEILEATGGKLLCGREDVPLVHISIDSRFMKGSDLFVPLVGERVDAHRFIGSAFAHGAAASLTGRDEEPDETHPLIRVADTKLALQDIGRYLRNRLRLPLVGITGSVGKTTTREMIAAALSAGFRVFRTPGNHNSQVGVPITISEISSRDEIGVIELGMSEPGELTVIAGIARVNMAVITNIGVTHIEQLGSRENIYREKLTIQDGLEPGGVLFLNGDDDLLRNTRARDGFSTLFYGLGENCDYRAEEVCLTGGCASFTAVHGGERARVSLQVAGAHHVSNAMAALAVAGEWGIPLADAAERLGDFTGFQNRQQIRRHGGVTVIDDTYNASPVSMRASLEILYSMEPAGRRLAVLADMKELGEEAPRYHHEIGASIAGRRVDEVLLLGDLAGEIARGIREHTDRIAVRTFENMGSLKDYLKETVKPGDCVLFKGSNSMRLKEAAALFLPEHDG